jgi:hypothetical protein
LQLLSKIFISSFLLSTVHKKQQKQHCAGLHTPGQHSISAIGQVSPSSAIMHCSLHCALSELSTVIDAGATVNVTKQNNNILMIVFTNSNIQTDT